MPDTNVRDVSCIIPSKNITIFVFGRHQSSEFKDYGYDEAALKCLRYHPRMGSSVGCGNYYRRDYGDSAGTSRIDTKKKLWKLTRNGEISGNKNCWPNC